MRPVLKTLLALVFSAGLYGPGLAAAAATTDDPVHGPVVEGKCDGSKPVRLSYERTVPTTKVKIDGQPVTAIIDTGASATLFDHSLVGPDRPRTDPKAFKSYYGDFQTEEILIDTIDLGGGCTLKNVPVRVISGDNESIAKILDGRILLGRDIMGQFDWIFDAPDNQLWVRRAKAPRDRTRYFYGIEYETSAGKPHLCLLDSGLGYGETMLIYAGSPILTSQGVVQKLNKYYNQTSGPVELVAITGRIAGGPWQSFIAAIGESIDPVDETWNHCTIGARYMLDHTLLLRADKGMVDNISNRKK